MNGRSAAIFCAILLTSSIAFAAPRSAETLDSVVDAQRRLQSFPQVAISPDGTRVAFVQKSGIEGAKSQLFVADVATRTSRRLTASKTAGDESGVAWSHDGHQLAFLSDDSSGQSQLWTATISSSGAISKPRRLTNVRGELAEPSWSPDDSAIAFLFIENAPRKAGPTAAMLAPTGVIDSKIFEQRLATVPVSGGDVKQISPTDMYVYEYDWSPDGRTFATIAARGEGDSQWWVAQLQTLDRASGAMKTIYVPRLQIAVPRFSPDGKEIAFIQGLMSDEDVNGGDLWSVPVSGGEARNLTPNVHGSVSWLQWLPDRSILFTENVDGLSTIATLVPGSQPEIRWSGAEAISESYGIGLSATPDGKRSAIVRSSSQHPVEVWSGTTGSWDAITSANASVKPAWGEARNVIWESDGLRVQGWLLSPRDVDTTKKYPMVVHVHGGPSSAVLAGWPIDYTAALLSSGYFVFQPNPRGSYGQGETFTRANVRDFGYGDLRDILAGVKEVERVAPVDPQRVGIWGWSYGGYMTMWAVTQTNAFRAAVAGAGIANWLSYYGENDIDEWMIPFFGASVYDDPYIYARSAPINFIRNVKTPTLVVVGDRDGECPAPQSFEFYRALRTLGIKTQLVVYPDEGHSIRKPADRRDIARRLVQWFDENM